MSQYSRSIIVQNSDINEKIDGLQIVEINLKKLAEM